MMETMRVMSLDQKSRFLMLGPCSSGATALAWDGEGRGGVLGVTLMETLDISSTGTRSDTHWIGLVFSSVELVAVVEDVVVGGVETGLHTVLHHLAVPGRALELLDLRGHTHTRYTRHTPLFFPGSGCYWVEENRICA